MRKVTKLASAQQETAQYALISAALALISTAVFWVFFFRGEFLAALGMGLFCGGAAFIPLHFGFTGSRKFAWLVIPLAFTAAFVRVKLFPYVSNDYVIAFQHWMEDFRQAGGFAGLAENIGDYNYPYRYFLALFSYLPTYDLYLIKLLSVGFDLLLAYYAARLCGLFTESPLRHMAAFFVLLFLPTVVLNGAKWAQCDGIYSSLMLGTLYYGLSDRPVKAVVCSALAFAAKLQSIFLLPILAVFWIAKRVKFKHLLLFPVVYLAAMLPALIAGHTLYDIFFVYFNQTNMFSGYLTLNAPSIFMLIGDGISNTSLASTLGTIAGFVYLLALLLHALVRRTRLGGKVGAHTIMRYALAMCVGIPFILPSMHERYFYMAETLAVVCACACICSELLPVLIQIPPLLCYDAYFRGYYRVYPEIIGSIMLLCAIIVTAAALFPVPSIRLTMQRRKNESSEGDLI